MNNDMNKIVMENVASQDEAFALIGRLFEVAKPSAVFSEPQTVGDYTVITAGEVMVSMGAGFGGGGGSGPEEDALGVVREEGGFGVGGGGGGFAMGRASAAISVGPDGVRVEPIFDVTKVAIALFTTFAAIVATLAQIARVRREMEQK